MARLTEEQVQELARHLPLRHALLRDELLDHLCCLVEAGLDQGLDYPAARAEALERLSQNEVQRTEGETLRRLQQQPMLMKVTLITSLAGVALALLVLRPHLAPAPATPEAAGVAAFPQEWAYGMFKMPKPYEPDIAPVKVRRNPDQELGFGLHRDPISGEVQMHQGLDIRAPRGTEVHATAAGTVELAQYDDGRGLYIIIRHDERHQTSYGHLDELNVRPGEKVKKDQVIGRVGSTGRSTGPHLHYEVLVEGQPVDPGPYLGNRC